jgi:hypothetical protein
MITTCKHCNASFDGGVEIVGQPGARLATLLHKLGSHMNKQHPEHAQAMGIIGADFMGWLFLANFKSADEQLNLYCDQRRWHIHQQTFHARFSDGELKNWSDSVADDVMRLGDANPQAARELIYQAMIYMRERLEEPNRYSAQAQPAVVA